MSLDYHGLFPHKPPVQLLIVEEQATCQCGSVFMRKAKTKIRCGPCQEVAKREQQKKQRERLKARRRARRLGHSGESHV